MYCTVDDVVHELHPTLLKEMERHYGDRFNTNIEKHIEKAEAFVNASLARVYSIPLIRPTVTVISAECKIAAYFAGIAYSEKDEILRDKYQVAREILNNLVEADNPILVDESADTSKNSSVLYGTDERIFTSDELAKW